MDPHLTSEMGNGRHAGTERRRSRGQEAITTAAHHGTPLTASAIARAARVDRTFLYRHRDLLALIHAAELEPAQQDTGAAPVSRASLQADLANAQARNTRLVARIQQLEKRLSEAHASLEEREAEPEAARAANPELTRALKQKGAADR
jgi:uncharacterized protein YlxW (UPF0749 family)